MSRNLKNKDAQITSWASSKKYISSSDEDKFVIDYFKGKKEGYLLDISAADGVTGSNSFRLIDEYEWKGILVEPCKEHKNNLDILYSDLDDIKVFYGAIHNHLDELFLHEKSYDAIGCSYTTENKFGAGHDIKKSYKVPAISISELLKKFNCPKEIDFISLDIEGSERQVIDYIDIETYNIKLWCVEQGGLYTDFFERYGYSMLNTEGYNIFDHNVFWGKKL